MTTESYFDASFQPSMRKFPLDNEHKIYIARWAIGTKGVPFPTENGRKAAYWKGTFNDRHETPVIAVSAIPQVSIENGAGTNWFVGIANAKEIADLDSKDEIDLYFAETASFNVPTIITAFKFLDSVLPIEVSPVIES